MSEYGSPDVERSMLRPPVSEAVPYGVGTPDYISVVLPLEVEMFSHGVSEAGILRDFMQVDIVGGEVREMLRVVSRGEVLDGRAGERDLTELEYSQFIERVKDNPNRDEIVAAALVHLLSE